MSKKKQAEGRKTARREMPMGEMPMERSIYDQKAMAAYMKKNGMMPMASKRKGKT